MIGGLRHSAVRCPVSEATQAWPDNFPGPTLARGPRIGVGRTGRAGRAQHPFAQSGDGSFLAFVVAPAMAFACKRRHDCGLRIAMASDDATMDAMVAKAPATWHARKPRP